MSTACRLIRCVVCAAGIIALLGPARAVPIAPDLDAAAPEVFAVPRGSERPPKASDLRRRLEQGIESFRRGDLERTRKTLEEAVAKHPELPPAPVMLARLFIRDHQHFRARALLEQAAAEVPGHPGAFVTFGELTLAEGRLSEAAAHFRRALSLAQSERWTSQRRAFETRIYAGLSAVAAQGNDWASAKAHLLSWLEFDSRNGSIRQRLAQVLFKLGEERVAYQELQKAVAYDPKLEPAATSMGRLYAEKGDLRKANVWMKRAVRTDSNDRVAHRVLATTLLRQGKVWEASRHAEAAAQLDPSSSGPKALLGLIAHYRKDYSNAESIFEGLHRHSPGDSSASNQLALVLAEQSDRAKQQRALRLAETNVRQFPNSAEAVATLGRIYHRVGRIDEAERTLQAATSAAPAAPDSMYYLAQVMFDRSRLEQARELLKAALKTEAVFLFREEARELLKRINRKSP